MAWCCLSTEAQSWVTRELEKLPADVTQSMMKVSPTSSKVTQRPLSYMLVSVAHVFVRYEFVSSCEAIVTGFVSI